MSDIGNVKKRFLDLATDELSFRKQITTGLIQVLKDSRISPGLKLLIVSALFAAICLSFIALIFLGCLIRSLLPNHNFRPGPEFFVYAILAVFAVFISVAITVVFKASTTEQSLRLEDGFEEIYKRKIAG